MDNLIDFLIPDVSAQTLDTVSEPTFGPLDLGGSGQISGSVLISASDTSVEVGKNFTLQIEVNTNDVNVSEYRISIDFDPTKFTVVDADSNATGTQINFLDEVFEVESIEDDNTVSNVGRIRLVAKAPADPLTVNRRVAEVTFQAQSVGTSTIQVVEGSTGTQIVRSAGIGLAYTSNEVAIEINQANTSTNGTTTTSTTGSTTGGTTTISTSTTGSTGTGKIPETAVPDGVADIIMVAIGLLSMGLGTLLWVNRKPTKNKGD